MHSHNNTFHPINPAVTAARGLLLLAVVAAFLSMCASVAGADPEPVEAPPNPAFVDYLQNSYISALDVTETEYPGGLIPEPFDLSLAKPMELASMAAAALPSSYDLRALDKLTDIRNQGQCGSCWGFAAIGSLESSLMPGESCDFSENNLKNLSGFATGCCLGGDRVMATAYMARWAGPVAESDDRYVAASCASPKGLVPAKHVQDVDFLPNRTGPLDNDALKQAVMAHGAVYTTYYQSTAYADDTTSSYYYYGSTRANHAVCIVGWNDNYSAGRFRVTPPGDGAFLVRNSWGTWWGTSGYFWISYYDSILGKYENAAFRAEPNTNYDQVYQYDPLGWVANAGYGSHLAWFANVFTATSNSAVAAASWFTPVPRASYELYVHTDPIPGSPMSVGGADYHINGTLSTAGYHTVRLPAVVPITAGQKFSVVVKLSTPGYSYPICLERPYAGYSPSAVASPGQSYMSSNGSTWTDVTTRYANSNVCLKAFTMSSGDPPAGPGVLSVTPASGLTATGAVGGPFGPISQTYTLTNTGQSAINWTANAIEEWLDLSSTDGELGPAESATVTASINSSANALPAGLYADSISFTNATNGMGSTTRGVDLTISDGAPPPAGAYEVLPTSYSWIDPTNHTQITLSDDSVSAAQRLPFTFTFYGGRYSRIYVGSNGLLGMISTAMSIYANSSIPLPSWPNLTICPYWDDLNPTNGGSVRIGTVGSAPNRKVVISWLNVPPVRAATAKLTFQAILCEGTNDIIFQYQNVAPTNTAYGAGASATVGLENDTGSEACAFSYNSRSLANGMAIRFAALPTSFGMDVFRQKWLGLWRR